jgi:hypothetical protein
VACLNPDPADGPLLLLTVCIAEVGIFIAAFRPVQMLIRQRKVEFNEEILLNGQAPNRTCNVIAAEVPMSCPNFGNAMLAAEISSNCFALNRSLKTIL